MATSSYITPSLSFNRAAILRAAHAEARQRVAKSVRYGAPMSYALAFSYSLRATWGDARVHLEYGRREARIAAASAHERMIARLEDQRFAATMIDSTARMLAEVAAIDARIADLRAAA